MGLLNNKDRAFIVNELKKFRQDKLLSITFVKETLSDCPDCDLNPVTKESTNPFCPTCDGSGYVITSAGTNINASIEFFETMPTWKALSKDGIFEPGTAIVSVDYQEAWDTSGGASFFDTAQYVLIDSGKYEVRHSHKAGWGMTQQAIVKKIA